MDQSINIVVKAIDQTKQAFSSIEKDLSDLQGKLKKTEPSFRTMAIAGTAAFSGIALATKGFLQTAGEFEQQSIAFETMLGSAEAGSKMLNDLIEFAKRTPFEVKGISETAKQLMAMGIQSKEVIPTVKILGDVSAGLSVPLERVALNFGQVASQGKMTGRELRDFAMMGVPILDELSKMLGVSKEAVTEMVSAGEIGFEEVRQAFVNMTSEGGKFADLMGKQAQSLLGSVSNLKDSFTLMSKAIGDALRPQVTKLIQDLTATTDKIVDWVKENAELVKNIILVAGAVSALIAALGSLGMAFFGVGKFVGALAGAFGALRIAMGFLIGHPIIALLALIAVSITSVIVKLKSLEKEFGSLNNAWKSIVLSMKALTLEWVLNFYEAVNSIVKYIPILNTSLKNAISDVKNEIRETNLEFTEMSLNVDKSSESAEELGAIEQMLAGITSDLTGELGDLGEGADESFKTAVEGIKELRQEIRDVYKELESYNVKYNENVNAENESFNEEAVKMVAEAQSEIGKTRWELEQAITEGNAKEIERLSAQLTEQENIIRKFNEMNLGLEKELAEYKEYLRMDEMSKLEFDHQKKLLLIQKEYLENQVASLKKLNLLKQEYDTAVNYIGKEKEAAINAEIAKTASFQEQLEAKTKGLKGWIEEQKSLYSNYVDSINSILSRMSSRAPMSIPASMRGYQYGTNYVPQTGTYLLHKGEEVVPAKSSKGSSVVVNINGGTYLSPEVAQEIGDMIIDKLKMQFSF